jgi:hypothetical protein
MVELSCVFGPKLIMSELWPNRSSRQSPSFLPMMAAIRCASVLLPVWSSSANWSAPAKRRSRNVIGETPNLAC